MTRERTIAEELSRAEGLLSGLSGEVVPSLTVNSSAPRDAPFFSLIVSKLSPIIGNLFEKRIVELLDDEAEHGYRWVRQDPGFPDALLVDDLGESTQTGFEVKAWYAMSTELTGRFRESVNLLAPRNVHLVVVSWAMSEVVFGSPTVLGTVTIRGVEVAKSRDSHYHQPPTYLIVEPGDTTARTVNLQQTNVNGYRLQETDPSRIEAALEQVLARTTDASAPPHSAEAQTLVDDLMNTYRYRLDTNFAKIDRVDNIDIERFKAQILASDFRGKAVREWVRVLGDLSREIGSPRQVRAEQILAEIYRVAGTG